MERWSFLLAPYSLNHPYRQEIEALILFVNQEGRDCDLERNRCYEYFYIFEKSLLHHLNTSYEYLSQSDDEFVFYYMQSNGQQVHRFCALLSRLIKGELLALNPNDKIQFNYLCKQSQMIN